MSERLALAVKQRWKSRVNTHQPGKYVGVSTLVSKKAEDIAEFLADYLHRGIWHEETHFFQKPMHEFGFLGNTLADGTLCNEDGWVAGEFCVQAKIDPDLDDGTWLLQGHPDKAAIEDGKVWFGEAKGHADPTEDKREKARRQDLLNLAIAWHNVNDLGNHTFYPASYIPKDAPNYPEHYTFHWPVQPVTLPGGILTAIVAWYVPNEVISIPVTEQALDDILGYYARKAHICIEAALADNPEQARLEWTQKEGRTEFDTDILALNQPKGTIEALVEKERRLAAAKKEAEKAHDSIKASLEEEIKRSLPQVWDRLLGEKLPVGEWTVTRQKGTTARKVDADKLEKDGFSSYVTPGRSYDFLKVS